MSDVRAHPGVPVAAQFFGLTTPSACAPLVVNSATGYIYALADGDTVVGSAVGGSVTSVAQSFTGGLISVAGSPITTAGTLALTVAGTSGGVPYFSGATTWASSAALAASAIVLGGGAGAAPATTATGTGVVTALGVNVGNAGAFVTFNGALGTPSSGTVTNLTGTASININGTVGGTTATTGAFTTISASGQVTSTVTTGTAPLVIASTTKVTNLNADLLDDQTGSYYLDSANFTGTNWTDLTDGGGTTLHTHAATGVTNFHALIAAHVDAGI